MRTPMTRRAATRMLLLAPAATALAGQQQPPPPSETTRFIAAREAGLSDEERGKLTKALTSQEKALATIRNFELTRDTGPSFRFAALRSRRRTGAR